MDLQSEVRTKERELAKLLQMKEYSASVVESLEYLTASLHTLMQGAQSSVSTSHPWEEVTELMSAAAVSSAAAAEVTANGGDAAAADAAAAAAHPGFVLIPRAALVADTGAPATSAAVDAHCTGQHVGQ